MTCNMFKRFVLCLLLILGFCAGQAQKISADYGDVDNCKMTAEFNAADGTVDFMMVVGTTFGASLSFNGHTGFHEKSANVTIGTKQFSVRHKNKDKIERFDDIEISGVDKGEFSYGLFKEGTEPVFGREGNATAEDEFMIAIYYKYKVRNEDLGNGVPVKIKGKYWHNGPSLDVDVDIDMNLHLHKEEQYVKDLELNKITFSNPEISKKGTMAMWSTDYKLVTTDKHWQQDSLMVQNSSQNILTKIETTSSEVLRLKDNVQLDDLGELKLVREFAPYGEPNRLAYHAEPKDMPFNAFPVPKNFIAYFVEDDHNMYVEWSISHAPERKFANQKDLLEIMVERLENVPEQWVKVCSDTLSYTPGQTIYKQGFKIKEGEDCDYAVTMLLKARIDNKEVYLREYYTTLHIDSRHYYPGVPHAEVMPSGMQIEVTWTVNGGVWSNDSKCYLVRHDESNGRDTEIELTKEQFLGGRYRDSDVVNYHQYRYTMKMIPGGEYGSQTTTASEDCTPFTPGKAISIEASQGEFAEKVLVKWAAKNYNVYSIERRRLDDPGDRFSEIARFDNASNSSTNNSFVDELTLPGILYQYNVICKNVSMSNEVQQCDTLSDFGFRKTSGDINGRIVFEDGSAVQGVDVRLSAYDEVKQYSLHFEQQQDEVASLLSDSVMTAAEVFTLQALVYPESSGEIITKDGVFQMGILNNHSLYMMHGGVNVNDTVPLKMGQWQQVTAVSYADSVCLFVDGKLHFACLLDSIDEDKTAREVAEGKVPIWLGNRFKGNLTEVRLWSRALTSEEIANNYNRYLVGNERGLAGYYNFGMPCDGKFFDGSFSGTIFNRHHGTFGSNVSYDDTRVPADSLLTFAGRTDENGVYSVRNVPYFGNGTAYMIKPMLNNHLFSPTSEVRFFGGSTSSHSVNFTDKSSFLVPISIKYSGGQYPVEGVRFEVDGNAVMRENKVVTTDDKGEATISVPIGIHNVQAIKEGHTFSQNGYLVDLNGDPINYQHDMDVRTFYDSTRVLFVGRVAGGAVQGDLPLGFGLSRNNLSKNSTVTFTPLKDSKVSSREEVYEYAHRTPSIDTLKWNHMRLNNPQASLINRNNNSNIVTWNEKSIVSNVAERTGEFLVWLLPEKYKVSVNIPGQDEDFIKNIDGNNAVLDMTSTAQNYVTTTIVDSVRFDADNTFVTFSSTEKMPCHNSKAYTLRVKPRLDAVQINEDGAPVPYFGDSLLITDYRNQNDTLTIWNNTERSGYYFSNPVMTQGKEYVWKLRLSEDYIHAEDHIVDHVACDNVEFNISNQCVGKSEKLAGDSITGTARYRFITKDPELTSGLRSVSIQATYGRQNNQASIAWKAPFASVDGSQNVYLLGAIKTGSDFVTAGPDNVLFVLRDPPGTNSYSYLQQGVSWDESFTSAIKLAFTEGGKDVFKVGFKNATIVGFVQEFTASGHDETTFDFSISEKIESKGTIKRAWSTNSGFKTKNSASYVGSDGDLYVGYSTNLIYGQCVQVCAVRKADYEANKSFYNKAFTYDSDAEWVLVSQTGTGMGQKINTMFAFAQKDIISLQIPRLESMRKSLFYPLVDNDITKTRKMLEAEVEKKENASKVYYLTTLSPDDVDFAKSGTYEMVFNPVHWNNFQLAETTNKETGETEKVYAFADSVSVLSQWIDNWKKQIALNEEAKSKATNRVENFSFAAGSGGIENKESYTLAQNKTSSFTISTLTEVSSGWVTSTAGGFKFAASSIGNFKFAEDLSETLTGNASRTHTTGFVLQDDDTDNQLSVSVYREPAWKVDDEMYNTLGAFFFPDSTTILNKDHFSTFIFKKEGGATSTPYEGAETVKYWEGHIGQTIDAATMHVDKPVLKVVNHDTYGVPMGDEALVDIEMSNASESYAARPYMLKVKDETVPDGLEITIDGVPVKSWPVYKMDYGETLRKTLHVKSGKAQNYDNIKLMLTANHGTPAIADKDKSEDTFNVHFVPSSSPVSLTKPSGNWTFNTQLPTTVIDGKTVHLLNVEISGYDVNYPNFTKIVLQTKRKGDSDENWLEHASWSQIDLANLQGKIFYDLVLDGIDDGEYELRALSVAEVNNEKFERSSEIRSGVKDMICPRTYGDPSPANGILTVGSDIEITFNEPIAQEKVSKDNVSLQGVLNNVKIDSHSTYVSLDGQNGMLVTDLEHNLSAKPLTIMMDVRPRELTNATIFAHGGHDNCMELGITDDGYLQVCFNNKVFKANKPCDDADLHVGIWCNLAMTYDPDRKVISAYCNGKTMLEASVDDIYQCTGPIELGHCQHSPDQYFHGDIASLYIWNMVFNGEMILEASQRRLTGREPLLLACYNMDEGNGTVLKDKSRGVNLIMMQGVEWTLPEGRALMMDGNGQYAQVNASKAAIPTDGDWTLQFWFKSNLGQKEATILSTGEADASDTSVNMLNRFGVRFNKDGELQYDSNHRSVNLGAGYNDGNWHCMGVTTNRTDGFIRFYLDGKLKTYRESTMFGGVQTSLLTIGAKQVISSKEAPSICEYFNGQVDDIQLWNLCRTQSQMEQEYNSELWGTEKGLRCYWPFDYYNKWEQGTDLEQTMMNLVDRQDDGLNQLKGGAIFTNDCAPVKDAKASVDLPFEIVTSDRSILILPSAANSSIENTTLTVSVSDIEDLHGNKTANSYTWTALVHKALVEWAFPNLTLQMNVDEAFDGSFFMINSSGNNCSYSITNAPSWLHISEPEGICAANTDKFVNYTIDKGIAVGDYNEILYLNVDGQSPEPLYLEVKVRGEQPNWTPANPQSLYKTNVFGQMKFDGHFSQDTDDMLGAFLGNKCVGVARTSYDYDLNMYYALLTIHYDPADTLNLKTLEFRTFDSSTGCIYMSKPSQTVVCRNNAIYGTPTNPVVFEGEEERMLTYQLKAGWNWISLPLYNEKLASVKDGLSCVEGSFASSDLFKSFDNSCQFTNAGSWSQTERFSLNNKEMYMIHVKKNAMMQIRGTTNLKDDTIAVKPQWNWISYLPLVNLPLIQALAGYEASEGDVIKNAIDFAVYSNGFWVGSLKYMEPGCGYMLFNNSNEKKRLVYPSKSSYTLNLRPSNMMSNVTRSPHTMGFIAEVEGMLEGDELLVASADAEPMSATVLETEGRDLHFMSISADEGKPLHFYVKRGDELLNTMNAVAYAGNTINGTLKQPLRIVIGDKRDMRAYPMMASTELNVDFVMLADAVVRIQIFDLQGRLMKALPDVKAHMGLNTQTIDVTDLSTGSYVVRVLSEEGSEAANFMKK